MVRNIVRNIIRLVYNKEFIGIEGYKDLVRDRDFILFISQNTRLSYKNLMDRHQDYSGLVSR